MPLKILSQPLRVYSMLLLLSLSGCGKFEFSPNEVRLQDNEKNLNLKYRTELEQKLQGATAFKFAIISDTQRFYDELEACVASLKSRPDIDFIILTGDISDFGTNKEFSWVHERMLKAGKPYLTVIGNHDCVGNGKKIFEAMYGPYDYTMQIGRNRFVFINTNSREFEDIVPDLETFRNSFSNPESYDQAFVFSHVPPFDEDFNQSLAHEFANISNINKVKLSAHGHKHRYQEAQNYYQDAVPYLIVGTVQHKSYELVTVDGANIHLERITF